MGDGLRARVLLYLGLGKVWVELDALSTRLKRLEADTYGSRKSSLPPAGESDADTGVRDRLVSTVPGVPFSRNHQTRRQS